MGERVRLGWFSRATGYYDAADYPKLPKPGLELVRGFIHDRFLQGTRAR